MQESFGWPEALAGRSLLAAGLLAALGRRRRQQLWHRAFGRMIARPEGDAALAEQALRIGADAEPPRCSTSGSACCPRPSPPRTAPRRRSTPRTWPRSLDLWIPPPDPDAPAPWTAHDGGQVGGCRRTRAGCSTSRRSPTCSRPYPGPGLARHQRRPAGCSSTWRPPTGLIALDGPADHAGRSLAALAVELATNRWSDRMRVTLVGFGEELTADRPRPDPLRAGSLAEVLPELEAARARRSAQSLAASGADSVLTGRCHGVFGEAWMPHYLIMADQPDAGGGRTPGQLARTGQRWPPDT